VCVLFLPSASLALFFSKINFTDLKMEEKIGEGSFAVVYKGTYQNEEVQQRCSIAFLDLFLICFWVRQKRWPSSV